MANFLRAASTLSTAVGLALGLQALPASADDAKMPMGKDSMAQPAAKKLQKCYGINAVAKNDCAEGAHSCAGQATKARDPMSFVLVPVGDCDKIDGGKTKAT